MKVTWFPILTCSHDGLEKLITERCKVGLYVLSQAPERPQMLIDLEKVLGTLTNPVFNGKEVTFELTPRTNSGLSLDPRDNGLLYNGAEVKLGLCAAISKGVVVKVICYNLLLRN